VSNLDPDRYSAVDDGPEVEARVKGSRFVGQALRVENEGRAVPRLDGVRRVHHAATHHCWALRLGPPEAVVERFGDAGEPAGTAGRPILDRLRGRDLYETLLVVTRYFGGTKLGTGGLARAYAEAADRALEAAPARTVRREARFVVRCSYDDLGTVEAAIARAGDDVHRVERDYDAGPRMLVAVRRSRGAALAATIVEATAGRAEARQSSSEET